MLIAYFSSTKVKKKIHSAQKTGKVLKFNGVKFVYLQINPRK